VVYGIARIDSSGRICERAIITALRWAGGDRLTFAADAGVVTARRDPGGMVTLPASGYLTIPAALRQRCGLEPGDQGPVAGRPDRRPAAENLIAALRCLYKRSEEDGLIDERDNPVRKVDKPRRLPSTRRAVADTRLAEINRVAAITGDDPELDTLILRLHTETACRRGGALALRPQDLDPDQCLVLLREKGETVRWQPVSPTLNGRAALLELHPGRAP
jgi:integrase